ncbi:response regulator transcription factor [Kineosporia mesophila]|uniref:Response regulator transcription factor n=1 Tax=Kineosporia mesophila TaxID=566012 RepID=A0ABP7A1L8_9ACTN
MVFTDVLSAEHGDPHGDARTCEAPVKDALAPRAVRPARPDSAFVVPSISRVHLVIQASDPLTYAGLSQHVARRPDIELLPTDRLADADVVAVVATTVTPRVMEQMRRAAGDGDPRFVLVLERFGDLDLLAAVEIGAVSVLWWAEATSDRFAQAVVTAGRGGSELPPDVQARLVTDVAELQRELLAPLGLTPGGLSRREVDVLRWIADGRDTAEIARKMLYSERTVKGILYGLMSRLHLKNRSHAVAYALRAGIL